jgi:hypothetical protein
VIEGWFRSDDKGKDKDTAAVSAQHWLPRSALSTRSKWWAALDALITRAGEVWVEEGYGAENGAPSGGATISTAELERMLVMLRPPM